jgi:negative regulator of flagellin synthesis FlgM
MINGIGLSSGGSLSGLTGGTASQRSDATARAKTASAALEDRASVSTTFGQIAAAGAPIDGDRVSALRAAIKAGTYRADPTAISTAMIRSDLGASL